MQTTLDIHPTDRIEQAFTEYHAEHPELYRQLLTLTRQWVSVGHGKLGIATLFEKLRWEWHVSGLKDQEGYKLNNNYRALYARLIMDENPELDGVFDIRERTTTRFGETR